VVDVAIFVIANLVSLLIAGLFLCRPRGLDRLERALGLASVSLALPAAAGAVLNALGGRPWWTVALPLLLVVYLVVELFLDYVWHIPFRQTALLGPYLLLYYLALMGMIGYNFAVSKAFGIVTLATYCVNLLASWYSYSRVGHGPSSGGR
jgi:hypothetical protein